MSLSLSAKHTELTRPLYLLQLILHLALGRLDLLDIELKGCCCGLELLLHVSSRLLQQRLHQGLQGQRVGLLLLRFGHVGV